MFFFTKQLVGFIGWTLATAIALAATYGPYTSFRDGGRPFTLVENVLYGTFSRFSWALCVAWVVFACHFEIGGRSSYFFMKRDRQHVSHLDGQD